MIKNLVFDIDVVKIIAKISIFEEFVMKKILVILIGILLSGCVAERKGDPTIESGKVQKCPDAIKITAKNLEQLGLDKEKLRIWMNNTLSMKEQPCSICQKLIEAAYILKDESNYYKPLVSRLLQTAELTDPNNTSQTKGQNEDIKSKQEYSRDAKINALAGQYFNSVDTVKSFLITQLNYKAEEANNFTIDHFFVPLMKNQEKAQDSNQPKIKAVEPKT
jgi:coenzyme F420-reducing hydrogenase delta subunit